ncbi:acyltransferase [Pedobacter gandavensis]|uniref:acyltransferase family protein n=1 Tax=Pedobacter TaxID=84567 RepID=UPI001C994C3B|nr:MULTISPECIES: acyltransferase [Pedobacter]WGQ10060.1 acyltransferase [Pedobacter gandavensis]
MKDFNSRVIYLDWLRIFAIIGVLLFHSARPFQPEDPWHVNNAVKSEILGEFSYWLSRFRMPLLFFISGAVSWFMIKGKTIGGFIILRLRRLFIPLLFGMLIIVPPQVYLERVNQGYSGTYLDFYPSIFTFHPYPKGNFSWHHLWFIAYLFLYDLMLAPFFVWCRSANASRFIKKLEFFGRSKYVYLLTLPSIFIFAVMAYDYPGTNDLIHDPLYFFYWLLFLMVGFIAMLQPKIMDSLDRNRHFSLKIAFLTLVLINVMRWNDYDFFAQYPGGHGWRAYLFLARQPINSWFWVFAILGYGKHYLNKSHDILPYLNQCAYPFFILHQTIIVVVAYYVVRTDDTVGMKYLFILLTSFAICMLIFHLFIRPYPPMRLLFGMKALKKARIEDVI